MGIMEVKNLTLKVGDRNILNGLNLDLWEGYVHAIVGPNGAGKSTLASCIMGLSGYREIDGEILFEGQSIKDMEIDRRAAKGITMGWQEPARFEGLKVRDYIRSPAWGQNGKIVEESLSRVGRDPSTYADRAVDKTLSGGERKKIELASIVAMKPRVVFLDEPDSGIDVESLGRIFDAVKYLKSGGTTVVLITHSVAVLNEAEHAFLLCNGEIVDKGSVDKIMEYFEGKCLSCDHVNNPRIDQEEKEQS
jgi:Fe-S cluster assembly ATP-binding protein